MRRLLAKIAYDGTNFCGWQIQPTERTVQQEIETALTKIVKTEIKVVAAGRTDAGVHARGQHIHFDFPLNMTPVQIMKAMQTKLSKDIKIVSVAQVKQDFHARYDAFSRSYNYIITKNPDPFNRHYKSSFQRSNLNLETMQSCAKYFLGKHDFTSFSKFNPDIKSTICTISSFEITQEETDIIFKITADRFLHNMVRRIVGTIVNISDAEESPQIITILIEAGSTANKLITTAPPEGLYLEDVKYPSESFI
ncbi:MAG: tRNA pseudouridine(38-40) synthase TruA [Candidatus Cloacimonas sp. 4484_143]|nr:MAG: tRNA pseudouridine(38-40) synthase TruA [Candidatus Cloacimonas sp. 4484_143]RLC52010.1 MAG: tRNA pseudouridine(38-40) synthase TruA [Candidatus Cloacimonadota bacterium]